MKKIQNLFLERYAVGTKVILVHLYLKKAQQDCPILREFQRLAQDAGFLVLDTLTTTRKSLSPNFLLGKGMVATLAERCNTLGAESVIINHTLSPAQGRNLERAIGCRVLDRTDLILEIFSQRARTFEGRIQVEQAQLAHLRTRLIGGWTHLERQKGGIGVRGGPGETQLEIDRRLIDTRLRTLKKRLAQIKQQRSTQRRAPINEEKPCAVLVGYTNSGKTTLFNHWCHGQSYAAEQLFATLDTAVRYVTVPTLGTIRVLDTVGFIQDLPHELIAAFSATLEEVLSANLLLHVVDIANPNWESQIMEVEKVLSFIGAASIPQLYVLNKIDLLEKTPDLGQIGDKLSVQLSARTLTGVELLEKALVHLLGKKLIQCSVCISPKESKKRAQCYAVAAVVKEQVHASGDIYLTLDIQESDYRRIFQVSTQKYW